MINFITRRGLDYILVIGSFFVLTGCFLNNNQNHKEISFNIWVKDNILFNSIIKKIEEQKCVDAEVIYNKLITQEFKRKSSMQLARCFSKNNDKARLYLHYALDFGYNIRRIDSVKFQNIWNDIKEEYIVKNKLFWSTIDTTYFEKIERLVYIDQKVRNDRPVGSKDFSAEEKADTISTSYLLEYCKEYGFPKQFDPSYFETFRSTINPLILAIHADDKNKITLLHEAIYSAEKEIISYNIPINICKSFYVVGHGVDAVKPIRFIKFKNSQLDRESSFLELYAISELFKRDMPSNVVLQPSISNSSNIKVIEKELLEIKKILTEDLGMSSKQIVIKLISNENEINTQSLGSYLYTLTHTFQ